MSLEMQSISAINLAFLEDLGSSEYNPSISDKRTNTSASTNCDILAANWSLSPYLISKVATVSFSLIMGITFNFSSVFNVALVFIAVLLVSKSL